MRIVFLGNFRPSHSTESHVSATYELLGHEVLRLQEDTTPKHTIPALCEGADVFHWTDTWHSDYDGGFKALEGLRQMGIPSIGHTLDLFVGLEREKLLDVDPWFRVDYFFSPDGGHQEIFAAKGINHHWAPPGVFAPECYLAEPVPELVQDVIFVGSYGYHPEWPYRRELIDWLKTTYRSRFTHYDHASGMRGHRLNQLYASAKVVVGDSCCPGFTQTHYTSDRYFETPGRGGFLIAPRIVGIDHLVDLAHVVLYSFGDFGQLKRMIDYFLKNDAERERIRLAGHEWVKAHHTYTHRVSEMLTIIGTGKGPA